MRPIYNRIIEVVRCLGRVKVMPAADADRAQARIRFAALMPQKTALRGHLVLRRRRVGRFERIDTHSPRCHVHVFRLRSAEEIDEPFRALLAEAYAAGRQEHLEAHGRPSPRG